MGEKSQVTLCWKNHDQALRNGIWQLFETGFVTDTKMTCRGKELQAHRLILSLFSPVLRTMLETCEPKDDTNRVVNVSEMVERRDDIDELVQFLYTGKITVHRNRLRSLRHMAEKLDVESLITVIRDEDRTKETEDSGKTFDEDVEGMEEESSDGDYDWNDDDDNERGSSSSEDEDEMPRTGNKRKKTVSSRQTRSQQKKLLTKKSKERNRETEEKIGTGEIGDDSEEEPESDRTLRSKKGKISTVAARKRTRKTTAEKSEQRNDYVFRAFDADDEFGSDEDEEIRMIRKFVEEQNEAKANYVEAKDRRYSEEVDIESFNFDESNDYDERDKDRGEERDDDDYEAEKKRRMLPPRMNRTLSNQSKLVFVKKRQRFRERNPFIRCELCEYRTRFPDLLKRHVRNRHVYTPVQVWPCETCGRTFRTKEMHELHQLTHENPGVDEQKCPKCRYKTANMFSLRRHLACRHKMDTDGKPLEHRYSCTHCDYKCVHLSQLRYHMAMRHSLKTPYRCSECDYKSIGKYMLDVHVSCVHRKERNFMCEICGYNSKTKGCLELHRASHTNERKFECDVCGMKFNRSSYLKTHSKVHDADDKPYVCDECGHRTNRKHSLAKHMRRHAPGRVDGRRGRKKGVRRGANGIRTITGTDAGTTAIRAMPTRDTACITATCSTDAAAVGVHVGSAANVGQSQPADVYNSNYGYQQSYGQWMCQY